MPYGAQKEVAADLGIGESYVSAAMNEDLRPKTDRARAKLRRVQAAIAEKLGRPVEEVFPEPQQEGGSPMARAS